MGSRRALGDGFLVSLIEPGKLSDGTLLRIDPDKAGLTRRLARMVFALTLCYPARVVAEVLTGNREFGAVREGVSAASFPRPHSRPRQIELIYGD